MNVFDKPILLLDGATGTELARRGVDIGLPLWSARALLDAPEILEQIHRDYLEAGADLITTCTFRTHERSLAAAGMGDQAAALTRKAVEIARQALDVVPSGGGGGLLGSVAPLEDCYRPDRAPDEKSCRNEHAAMIRNLLGAGVDLILLETMNNRREAHGAIEVAQELAAGKWMISFCTKSDGPPGLLLDGSSIVDLVPALSEAVAVGVNCVAPESVAGEVELLRRLLPERVRIMAYANIGRADDAGNWIATDAVEPERYANYAAEWIERGATIVGGCCGTTPETIRAIAQRIRKD